MLFRSADSDDGVDESFPAEVEESEGGDDSWIVSAEDTVPATNSEDRDLLDAVLAELELPDGARGAVIELPDEAVGLGVVWFQMSNTIDTNLYSPLELARAFGTSDVIPEVLVENHRLLADAERVPVVPRNGLVADVGNTRVDVVEQGLFCVDSSDPLGPASVSAFSVYWNLLRTSCGGGAGICGSFSNNNSAEQIPLTNYYIFTPSGAEVAMAMCNQAYPPSGENTIRASLQRYIGSGNWEVFFDSGSYVEKAGLGFVSYGFAVNQYRMRVYSVGAGGMTMAAAQW